MVRLSALLVLALLGIVPDLVSAKAPAKGAAPDAIVKKMIAADPLGFAGAEAKLEMRLVNNRDQKRARELTMLTRVEGDTRRSFVRFTSPSDIAGTAFLGIKEGKERVQHLYMPALRKTRRISGEQRNGSFVGTDYSFADLDYRDIEDAVYERFPDEKVGKVSVYVVEAAPRDSASEYGRIRMWIAQDSSLPLKMTFFDKTGKERKQFNAVEIRKVDKRWLIFESKMKDLKRDHTTVLQIRDVKLREDVPLDQFTVRALERG